MLLRPRFLAWIGFAALSLSLCANANVYYVANSNCTGTYNGARWDTAYKTIQAAIDQINAHPSAPEEIRVAGGTYRPLATLVLPDGVTIKGNYQGCTGASPNSRTSSTTISADVNNDDLTSATPHSDNLSPIFSLLSNRTATLDGMSVKSAGRINTDEYGAVSTAAASLLTVNNVTFKDNWAGNGGGVIHCQDGSLELTNCNFSNNQTAGGGHGTFHSNGGAIYASSSDESGDPATYVHITSCTFGTNQADASGGAIYISSHREGFSMDDCTVDANVAAGDGGGLYLVLDSINLNCTNCPAAISGCHFDENQATLGGGIYLSGLKDPANLTISNTAFASNVASGANAYGGAAYMNVTDATYLNCTFTSNIAQEGGGVYLAESEHGETVARGFAVRFRDCKLIGNIAKSTSGGYNAFGGGVASFHEWTYFTRCQFLNNVAENTDSGNAQGGAIWTKAGVTDPDYVNPIRAENCTFMSNAAKSNGAPVGGAVYSGSKGFYTNCLFDTNSATRYSGSGTVGQAGALYLLPSAPEGEGEEQTAGQQVRNCTFSNNTAGDEAGGVFIANAAYEVFVLNSILYGNTDHSGTGENAQLKLESGFTNFDIRSDDIQGCSGGGFCADSSDFNTPDNPHFIDPDGSDGIAGNPDDNFRLGIVGGSNPCIDHGLGHLGQADERDGVWIDFGDIDDDDDPDETVPFDLDGDIDHPRFDGVDDQIDMGCYEYHP